MSAPLWLLRATSDKNGKNIDNMSFSVSPVKKNEVSLPCSRLEATEPGRKIKAYTVEERNV